jgi:hypothetical protein
MANEWICKKCGGINPRKRNTCLGCNSPIDYKDLREMVKKRGDWEYKDYVWAFTGGAVSLSKFGGFTMAGARLEVWSQCQSEILSDLQQWTDKGWKPIGEIGPSSLVFRDELRLGWFSYILFGIVTVGIGFLLPFLMMDRWAIPIEFRLSMRRHKVGKIKKESSINKKKVK